MVVKTGGCQCGRIRYRVEWQPGGHAGEGSLCHCRMCQRATGGFAAALVAFPQSAVFWEREPEWYASSAVAKRPFCRECGSPLGFRFVGDDWLELTLGSFDDPAGFVPTHHAGSEGLHEAWVDIAGLPRKRTDESPSTVAAWRAAGMAVPE